MIDVGVVALLRDALESDNEQVLLPLAKLNAEAGHGARQSSPELAPRGGWTAGWASCIHYTYLDKPGFVGKFGNEWDGIGLTQDGACNSDDPDCAGRYINDGGCNGDEESPDLNFARMDRWVFPRPLSSPPSDSSNVVGVALNDDINAPITFAARSQGKDDPIPLPTPTCGPGLTGVGSTAGPVFGALTTNGCSSGLGFRVYRSEGAGPYYLLRDLGSSTSFTDLAVKLGTTYHYAVSSYNEANDESSLSSGTTVTSTDSTPPAVPVSVVASGGDGQVSFSWSGNTDRDIAGYDVWMSDGSGYVKENGSLLPAYANTQWLAINLTNGQNYCFKVTATDIAGNTSSLSSAACATPGP